MPFIGTWKMLAGGSSDEPEVRKELLRVTMLPLRDWIDLPPSSISTQQAVDEKGNIYNVLCPTYESFSWKTFKFTTKYKFNAGERHLAEVTPYQSGKYRGAIGSIQFIKINSFGGIKYL